MNAPGSPSSALQQTYFTPSGLTASAVNCHFLPVGKPAPPRPTRPLFFIAARNDAWSVTSGGATVSATVWAPSDSMITVVSVLPVE